MLKRAKRWDGSLFSKIYKKDFKTRGVERWMRRRRSRKMIYFCVSILLGFVVYALVLTGVKNFEMEKAQRPELPQQGRIR